MFEVNTQILFRRVLQRGRARVTILAVLLISAWFVPRWALSQETPTEMVVANALDEVNGDTSSVENLQSNPGADGISLREAMVATNNDPGTYSIEFAADLAGTTIGIRFDSSSGGPLMLTGGGVTIDGDINGDGGPDVTVANAVPTETCNAEPDHGFIVSSSGNRLHALSVTGVKTAVVFQWQPGEIHQTYSDNEVSDLVAETCQAGIAFVPPLLDLEQCESALCVTDIRWLNTRILGNTIETGSVGINVAPTGIDGDLVEGVTISGNTINVASTDLNSFGINVEAGTTPTMEGNRIADVVIADNRVTGSPDAGIRVDAGGSESIVERVLISGNRVNIGPPVRTGGSFPVMRSGIFLAAGDTDALNGAYAVDNTVREVEIADNVLGGVQGVRLQNGCCGAARNVIRDVVIRRNDIETSGPGWAGLGGIWIEGGHGWVEGDGTPTVRSTRRNRMYDISIVANEISIESDRIKAGIWVTGGVGESTNNRVSCIRLRRNRVIGTSSVLVRNNMVGASGNIALLKGC